jgi:hypothetical protein
MPGQQNQLSRYGAISRPYPMTTGFVFFLVSATEAAFNSLQKIYPADSDGNTRVFTTWAAVISQMQNTTSTPGAHVVVVSPLFTTAPTKAQQLQLDNLGVVTTQAGANLPDGSYIAATATAFSLATNSTTALFQVNGRVEITTILLEVMTTIGTSVAVNAKLSSIPSVGSTSDLCATGTTTSLAVGGQMYITGTLTNSLIATTQSAFVRQASPLVMTQGTLQFTANATTTGNVKARVHYKQLDPGAYISPLI